MTITSPGQVPEALLLADQYAAAHAKWELEDLYGSSKSYTAEKLAERHAARETLERALRAAHVQNPAEIEHVAGDVSKSGAGVNMSIQQPVTQQGAAYDHGPQAETIEEAARDVGKWLNERQNRPLDLRHVAMLTHHALRTQQPAPATQQAGERWSMSIGPAGLDWLIADIRKLPAVQASEIDGEESDGTPRHWRSRPHVSLTKLERLLREFFTPPPEDVTPKPPAAQAAESVQDLQSVNDAVTIELLNERVAYLEGKLNVAKAAESVPAPIDMVLHCPKCGMQHIDAPDAWRPGSDPLWDNPPHRSHLCHGCGHIWRPADVPTNGVHAVKTKGKADSPIATPQPAVTAGAVDALDAAVRQALAMFPFNARAQSFTINGGARLEADGDTEFYSVKRVLVFLTELKTTLDAALAAQRGGA